VATGNAITVTDTVTSLSNLAAASTTYDYLSTTSSPLGATLLGTRAVVKLAQGAISTGGISVVLPTGISGSYYIVSCANGNGAVPETNTANNCSAVPVTVKAPDYAETAVTVNGTLLSGGAITVTDTATNLTGVAPPSTTYLYLTTSATAQTGTLLGTRSVPGLPQGAKSTVATSLTLPTGLSGSYYVVACANGDQSQPDGNPANNCKNSATLAIPK
jgi:hypothetical protein